MYECHKLDTQEQVFSTNKTSMFCLIFQHLMLEYPILM